MNLAGGRRGRTKKAGAALFGFALTWSSAEALASDPPPRPAPPSNPGDVEEVSVRGQKPVKPVETSLRGDEVRQVPGAFGDHFRVLETLPGVTPIISGLPFFFVRGAPPGNNGYYLDGVRVPVLYHVGFGPSVIHPGLIDHVDFFPGGYPARFGRFVGGILSGQTKSPSGVTHGEGNIRLFDAGALVETPFGGGKGTALLAGRYSYTGAIISLAAPEAQLDYWDYQGRVTWDLGPRDTIGAFVFGSYDFLGEKKKDPERTETIFATQFHRLDLRWDHVLPKGGTMRVATTLGTDSTSTGELQPVRDRMVGARLQLEQPVSPAVRLRAGVDANLDHYDVAPAEDRSQDASPLYPPRNDVTMGTYAEAAIHAAPRWDVTPGFRVDYFGSVRSLADATRSEQRIWRNAAVASIDPRLVSRLGLFDDVALVSTFAVTHQPPSFFIPVPGLQLGRLAGGLQTGVQTSQGLEIGLPLGFTFRPTVFYHHYLGLTDFTTTCGETSTEDDSDCIDRRVRGRTIGLEVLLRRALTTRLTGWISYTLSRTTRATRVFLLGRSGNNAEIPGDFDRTHVVNLIGAYDLGRGWRVGARLFFYTGRPYSLRAFNSPVPPYNSRRYPDFYRIDARVEKLWHVGEKATIALVFEWLNTTLRTEATSITCTAAGPRTLSGPEVKRVLAGDVPPELLDKCKLEEIGPITIPSIGVEGRF